MVYIVVFPTLTGREMKFCTEKETKTIYLSRFSDKTVFHKGRPLNLCIFLIKTVNFEHKLCIV